MVRSALGARLITLDTAGILALLNRRDANYQRACAALVAERRPFLVPAAILAEAGYMIERILGTSALQSFITDLTLGEFSLDCGREDLPRIGHLIGRYADLPLGLADAAVIACAERNGGRVLTFVVRHFGVVGREGSITVVP